MAEESTRQTLTDEQFRALIEHSSDIISLHDADGVMRYQSPSITPVLGYTQDELLGQYALDYVHPDDRPRAADYLATLAATSDLQSLPIVVRFRHANGSWRWFECSGSNRMADPRLHAFVFNSHDVTSSREAQQAARAGAALLDTVINAAPIAVFVVGQDLTYSMARGRALERAGLTEEELVGRSIREVHPESRHLVDAVQRAAAGETVLSELPIGSRVFNAWYSPYAGGDSDRVTAVIGVAFDVTEFRQLTEHLRQVQKLESIGLLAGGIAHDFNNMLTVIRGHADLLIEESQGQDDVVSAVEQIRQAADKATTLTYQLLAFSRKQVLQPRVLDVNDVINDTLKLLHRLIGENIAIRTQLDEHLDRVEADPGQITQVLMNLAVNARDAMPGGGTLSVETRNVVLDELYAAAHQGVKPGNYVLVAISDTGAGIEKDVLPRIFEPFFTTKPVGQGTGMGLSTVYGIVKQSGGNVWAYSELGQGTCFRVYLPSVGRERPLPTAASEASALPRGEGTILLVEDEDLLRTLAKRVLVSCGYRVFDAASPSEAIAVVRRRPAIDLLVTDVVMPGRSGVELAQQLRAMVPGLKVLYMSGYTFDSIMHQGVLPSDVEFLQKPFTAQLLTSRVRAVLD
jgi:two-component system cell cycle sensor histidine kinase/response regulator CckA